MSRNAAVSKAMPKKMVSAQMGPSAMKRLPTYIIFRDLRNYVVLVPAGWPQDGINIDMSWNLNRFF
jgi:hypothetical protein